MKEHIRSPVVMEERIVLHRMLDQFVSAAPQKFLRDTPFFDREIGSAPTNYLFPTDYASKIPELALAIARFASTSFSEVPNISGILQVQHGRTDPIIAEFECLKAGAGIVPVGPLLDESDNPILPPHVQTLEKGKTYGVLFGELGDVNIRFPKVAGIVTGQGAIIGKVVTINYR